ncbi:MAG: FAD-dependent oxidoreductase, partial [Patescibacteria group bacterium]
MSKIIIVGGGFGGVRAALDLEKKLGDRAEITLIDRNGYHFFAPALYEIASAFGLAKDRFSVNLRKTVSIPYGDIFEGKRIQFVQAEVVHISLEQRILTTKSDISFSFDYLILALGSQTADFNIPGVKEYAFQFKTIEDALMLNHQLMMLFEKASRGDHDLPLKFVVGGGGFAGVELAAELACAVKQRCKKGDLYVDKETMNHYKIIHGDCLKYLSDKQLNQRVDLTFLDPPFNQDKDYDSWNDNLPEDQYWQMMKDVCNNV